jgi:nitrous oxidase accessory protein NosD
MTGLSRRAFYTLLAASVGSVSGGGLSRRRSAAGPRGGDEVVTTRRELERAFEDLSPGDTIRISDRNAPYRTTEWLDVDQDGVTVVGPGVRNLVEPADGANVGGVRIGAEERCRDVTVRGIGYAGNPEGQSDAADRLHGIAVRNAADVLIEGNRVRDTHPRRHGDGGSGVSVTRRCSNVWVLNNRIREYGDRGVQLGGRRLLVYGNVITDGLDRPVACDLWDSGRENQTTQSVLIFGNFLGNSVEGSLVGIARNARRGPEENYVSVFGNVGFGAHKSFCHVRGPEPLRNISVQNNVSVQEVDALETDTTTFAGVAIDVAAGRNTTVTDNELYGYSGHGIHVNSDVEHVTVQDNTVVSTGLAGVRLAGAEDGSIDGNVVTRAGEAGVRLDGASNVAVRDNCVREPATAGVVAAGSTGTAGHDVADNYVTGSGRASEGPIPAVLVRDSGVRVRGNTIRQNGAPAIVEGDGAGENLYENNWADGERPWRITAPDSRVRNNRPAVDVHRDVSPRPDGRVVRVRFEKPYVDRPRLTFARVGGGVRDVSYRTDEDGHYVGADVTVAEDGGVLDVFVDGV